MTSLSDLQAQLDAFRLYYNESRPHRALDGRTPAQALAARVKAGPTAELASVQYRVRHDRFDKTVDHLLEVTKERPLHRGQGRRIKRRASASSRL